MPSTKDQCLTGFSLAAYAVAALHAAPTGASDAGSAAQSWADQESRPMAGSLGRRASFEGGELALALTNLSILMGAAPKPASSFRNTAELPELVVRKYRPSYDRSRDGR